MLQLQPLLPSPLSHPILLLLLTRQAVADQIQVLLYRCQHFVASTVDGSFGTEASVMGLVFKTGSGVTKLVNQTSII